MRPGRRITRERFGLTELRQNRPACLGPGRLGERPPQQPDRGLRGTVGERRACGVAQAARRPGIAGRLAAQQMGARARAPSALFGELQPGAAMAVGARGGGDSLVHRQLHQRMNERQRAVGARICGRDQTIGGLARTTPGMPASAAAWRSEALSSTATDRASSLLASAPRRLSRATTARDTAPAGRSRPPGRWPLPAPLARSRARRSARGPGTDCRRSHRAQAAQNSASACSPSAERTRLVTAPSLSDAGSIRMARGFSAECDQHLLLRVGSPSRTVTSRALRAPRTARSRRRGTATTMRRPSARHRRRSSTGPSSRCSWSASTGCARA